MSPLAPIRPLRELAPAVWCLLALGCGGSGDGSGGRGPDGDGAAGGAACEPPGYATDSPEVPFRSLTADVIDEQGAPLGGVRAQICGLDLCLDGTTDPGGAYRLAQDASLQRPAFKYGDGRSHAKIARLLAGPGPIEVELPPQLTVTLPAPETSAPLVPGTARSGDVSLVLAEDLAPVDVDPFDYDTDALRGFRAAAFPTGQVPEAVDASLGLEALFALSPVGASLCPPARLILPNRTGLPAGAAVEILLHGVEVEEEYAPYGGWAKVSDARVSSDGATIETLPGQGLPVLSLIGVRRAP